MSRVIDLIVEAVQPADAEALALLGRLLAEPPTPGELVALEPELERAVDELDGIARHSREVLERCTQLQPSPSPKTPAGF